MLTESSDSTTEPAEGSSADGAFSWGPRWNPTLDLYRKYRVCMVRVTVQTPTGDLTTGSAFHVGDGWLVTARHVIEGNAIHEIFPYHDAGSELEVRRILFHPGVDLALLETTFSLDHYMTRTSIVGVPDEWKADHIQIGGHLDDWLGDDLVLTRVLLMGYPAIPMVGTDLVAVAGEVNAVVDKYSGARHPFFLVSPLPRGGFSGGPVISEYGFLLGILTEALLSAKQVLEVGFAAALTVEPLWNLLRDNGIYPASNSLFLRYLEGDEEAERELLGNPPDPDGEGRPSGR